MIDQLRDRFPLTGSWPLLIAVTVVWALVWLVTQVIVSTPLLPGPTILLGLGLTLAVIAGYPSVMRGPRRRNGSAAQFAPLGSALEGESRDRIVTLIASLADFDDCMLVAADGDTATAMSDETAEALRGAASEAVGFGGVVTRPQQDGVIMAVPLSGGSESFGVVAGTTTDVERSRRRLPEVAALVTEFLVSTNSSQSAQLIADARLNALRAQINPHFLFNALNTIAAKSRTDPDTARQLLQRLADFFRYAMQQDGQFAEFSHEYFFVRTYLALEQARFAERLRVHYDVDPQVLPTQIPVLMVQPMVENAVKHGIAQQPDGGTVTLRARLDPLAGTIKITVRDDGVGMDPAVVDQVRAGAYRADSGGVAMRNIVERLDTIYGDRYLLDIRSTPGKGTRIDLALPVQP